MSKGKKSMYNRKMISRGDDFPNPYLILGGILVLTVIVYRNSLSNAFTGWDDPEYVFKNQFIRDLSFTNIKLFFSRVMVDNYQPLVMLSYAIEYKFFGLASPVPFHTTNLIFLSISFFLFFSSSYPSWQSLLPFACHCCCS